jgi:hypothetical protein
VKPEPAIHQLILAHPRPGMSEAEFQQYWLEVHAVRYAAKIKQIRKYLIATRIAEPGEQADPLWGGVAEIWLDDEHAQLESLQSTEFLDGARVDEPRWAAFWRTLALDTDPYPLHDGGLRPDDTSGVKLMILVKRREGLPLPVFRDYSLTALADRVREIPGLRRYLQGHVRDGAYAIGEATLDAVHQLWFDDTAALRDALASAAGVAALDRLHSITDPRYAHRLTLREHWVIGPEPR